MRMDQRVSYLSDNVKKLGFYQPNYGLLSQEECHNNLFLENGVLNWSAIEKIINLNECMSHKIMLIIRWLIQLSSVVL